MSDEQGDTQQGGSADVMPLDRLKSVEDRQAEVEESIRKMQNEFLIVQQSMMRVDAQREILEETQKRHDDEIRELKVMAAEMREGNNRLSIQYNSIYTTILQVLQQTQETNKSTQQLNSKERQTTQREFLKFLTWTIGAVIAAYAVNNFIP